MCVPFHGVYRDAGGMAWGRMCHIRPQWATGARGYMPLGPGGPRALSQQEQPVDMPGVGMEVHWSVADEAEVQNSFFLSTVVCLCGFRDVFATCWVPWPYRSPPQ
jgi:hypothetical protein